MSRRPAFCRTRGCVQKYDKAIYKANRNKVNARRAPNQRWKAIYERRAAVQTRRYKRIRATGTPGRAGRRMRKSAPRFHPRSNRYLGGGSTFLSEMPKPIRRRKVRVRPLVRRSAYRRRR